MKARGLTSARRAYRMMAALLALVTLSVLGGCGAKGDDVATIGRGEVEVSAAPGASTDALVSCLVDAGLPARLDEGLDGGVQLGWDEGHDIAVVDTYGGDWWIRDASRDYDEVGSQADHSRFLNAHQPDGASPYGLEVDGVDYSDVFATCVQNSGYAPVSESKDVRDEQVAKQALAEVTNDWLVCARENGYSDWPDVEAGEADDWLTSPQVSIPLST